MSPLRLLVLAAVAAVSFTARAERPPDAMFSRGEVQNSADMRGDDHSRFAGHLPGLAFGRSKGHDDDWGRDWRRQHIAHSAPEIDARGTIVGIVLLVGLVSLIANRESS